MQYSVHEKASIGFGNASDCYERGRPNYPQSAIEFLRTKFDLNSETSVLEIGAGTGKFTKHLHSLGVNVIAVEPVKGMRAKFQSILPEVEILNGTAEALPLGNSSVDHIFVAQAFHWFNGHAALKEFYRVLKSGGKLGLIWNVRDEAKPWVAELTQIIDPHEGGAPRYRSLNWLKPFEQTPLFSILQREVFSHEQTGPIDMVLDRVNSISFISALPDTHREKVLSEVRNLVENHPNTRGLQEFRFPYRTDVYWCARKD